MMPHSSLFFGRGSSGERRILVFESALYQTTLVQYCSLKQTQILWVFAFTKINASNALGNQLTISPNERKPDHGKRNSNNLNSFLPQWFHN